MSNPRNSFSHRLLVRHTQEDEAQCKEYCKGRHRDIDGSARQLDSSDDGRSQEGCAFGKDVVDAKILTGVFSRNDLGEITSRQ